MTEINEQKKKKVAYLMGGNQPLCNNEKLIETHEGHFVSPFTTVGWGGSKEEREELCVVLAGGRTARAI